MYPSYVTVLFVPFSFSLSTRIIEIYVRKIITLKNLNKNNTLLISPYFSRQHLIVSNFCYQDLQEKFSFKFYSMYLLRIRQINSCVNCFNRLRALIELFCKLLRAYHVLQTFTRVTGCSNILRRFHSIVSNPSCHTILFPLITALLNLLELSIGSFLAAFSGEEYPKKN